MTQGIVTPLSELIALQRLVTKQHHARGARRTQPGKHAARSRGRGMDISDIRHYQAGDEIRHMEWRVTARTGRPHIKLYEEERERPVLIIVDFNRSMYFGTRGAFKSFIAAQLAALLAWTALQQGNKVGGLMFSATTQHGFLPQLRQSGLYPFLDSLADYTTRYAIANQPGAQQGLSHALLAVKHLIKPGGLLILISDLYSMDADAKQRLMQLRLQHDLLTFHVNDPIEVTAPPPGRYPITDGQQTTWLDIRQASAQQTYQNTCAQRIQDLNAQFNQLRCPLHPVTASTPLDQLVRRTFPRRSYA